MTAELEWPLQMLVVCAPARGPQLTWEGNRAPPPAPALLPRSSSIGKFLRWRQLACDSVQP